MLSVQSYQPYLYFKNIVYPFTSRNLRAFHQLPFSLSCFESIAAGEVSTKAKMLGNVRVESLWIRMNGKANKVDIVVGVSY